VPRGVDTIVHNLLVIAALVASACALAANGSSSIAGEPLASAPPSTAAGIATRTSAPAPAPTGHGDTFGVDASIGYTGVREWLAISGGVALVEVAQIGPVRWSTESGNRPEESLLHSAPRGHEDTPGIGRLVEVRRVRILSGQWLGDSDVARYWKPGGRIDADEMLVDFPIPPLATGQQALALVLPQPGDIGGQGSIPVQVGWLFPVKSDGRVVTLDPNELVTLDEVQSLLP
jgi:hypothetical protein